MIRNQFQVTTNRLADRCQTGKAPVDGEALQNDCIRPEFFPETGASGRVHLGINPDSDLELRETSLNQFQTQPSHRL